MLMLRVLVQSGAISGFSWEVSRLLKTVFLNSVLYIHRVKSSFTRIWQSSRIQSRVVSLKYTDVSKLRTYSISAMNKPRANKLGGDIWNVSLLQWHWTVLYPRRLSHSYSPTWEPESQVLSQAFVKFAIMYVCFTCLKSIQYILNIFT
jgi:hypothetical protein